MTKEKSQNIEEDEVFEVDQISTVEDLSSPVVEDIRERVKEDIHEEVEAQVSSTEDSKEAPEEVQTEQEAEDKQVNNDEQEDHMRELNEKLEKGESFVGELLHLITEREVRGLNPIIMKGELEYVGYLNQFSSSPSNPEEARSLMYAYFAVLAEIAKVLSEPRHLGYQISEDSRNLRRIANVLHEAREFLSKEDEFFDMHYQFELSRFDDACNYLQNRADRVDSVSYW